MKRIENSLVAGHQIDDITDRKSAQQDINATLQRLKDIIEFLPDATFVIDNDRNVILWNRAIEELTGVKKEDILGRGNDAYSQAFYHEKRPILIDCIFSPHDEIKPNYSYIISQGEKLIAEVFIPHLDKGNGKHLWCISAPLYNHNGQRIGAIESTRDITEKKRTEEMIRHSEERYRSIFNNAIEGIFQSTLEGKMLQANPAFARILGWESPREIIAEISDLGRQVWVNHDDYERFKSLLAANGFVLGFEAKVYKKDRSAIWVLLNANEIKNREGRVGYFQGGMVDITAHKLAEEALLQSERRFRQIADNISDAFWVIDTSDRKFLYVNPAMEKIYGISFVGKFSDDINSYIHPDDRTRVVQNRTIGQNMEIEFRIIRSDGKVRWVRSRAFQVKNNDGQIYRVVGVTSDVTVYKKAAHEAELHRQQMIQTDKMASLGVLVSGVAHEINNPTNFIMLNAPLLRRIWESVSPILEQYRKENGDFSIGGMSYSKLAPNVLPLVDGIQNGANRIQQIVSDLKEYVRLDTAGLKKDIEINKVVQSALKLLDNMCRKHTDFLVADLAPDLPPVNGNHQRLEQVIINLVQNACNALTSKQQSITVTSFLVPDKERVAVTVADEGVGIPTENISRITDPFFTTRRERGGTGLGLSISSGIVKDHGGSLVFDSTPGKGTVVTLELPCVKSKSNRKESGL